MWRDTKNHPSQDVKWGCSGNDCFLIDAAKTQQSITYVIVIHCHHVTTIDDGDNTNDDDDDDDHEDGVMIQL